MNFYLINLPICISCLRHFGEHKLTQWTTQMHYNKEFIMSPHGCLENALTNCEFRLYTHDSVAKYWIASALDRTNVIHSLSTEKTENYVDQQQANTEIHTATGEVKFANRWPRVKLYLSCGMPRARTGKSIQKRTHSHAFTRLQDGEMLTLTRFNVYCTLRFWRKRRCTRIFHCDWWWIFSYAWHQTSWHLKIEKKKNTKN